MGSDSTLFSLTLRTGLASRTTLHLFELARFGAMLLSPSGFPSRSGTRPRGIALTLPGLMAGIQVNVYAAHERFLPVVLVF